MQLMKLRLSLGLVTVFILALSACSGGSQSSEDDDDGCDDAFLTVALCEAPASNGSGTSTNESTAAHLFLEDDGNVLYDDDLTVDDISSQLVQDQISSDGTSSASAENPWYWLSLYLRVALDDDSSYRIAIHSGIFDPEGLESITTIDGVYCSLDGNSSNSTPPLCEITQFILAADDLTTLTGWDYGDVVTTISYTVAVDLLDDEGNTVGSMTLTATAEDLEWYELVPVVD